MFPLVGGQFGAGFFLLPLVFALQVVMNVGIALLVSTYVTLVPDGGNVMYFVSRILFFVTPVIYPVALLPPSVKPFIAWQPLFPLFACYQAIFAGRTPSALLVFETLALGRRAGPHRRPPLHAARAPSSPHEDMSRQEARRPHRGRTGRR